METKSKKKFIKAWHEHIREMRVLQFTPSIELSEKVGKTLDTIAKLIYEVAEDKGLV